MDLERSQWGQLLWSFSWGGLKVESDLTVGGWRFVLSHVWILMLAVSWDLGWDPWPQLEFPHSTVAKSQPTRQKLHYLRSCVVSFWLLFIGYEWFTVSHRFKGRGIKESSRRPWRWEILLRPSWESRCSLQQCLYWAAVPYPNPEGPDVFWTLENLRILKGMVHTLNIYIILLERDGLSCKQKSKYFPSGAYAY